jgi:hypothetical protein
MNQNPELVVTNIKTITKVMAELVNSIFEPLTYKALGSLIFLALFIMKYLFDKQPQQPTTLKLELPQKFLSERFSKPMKTLKND